jgi:Holliday junction resolvase hjc
MSGGKAPRQKGNRGERALVRLLQDNGLAGERVPLSGSARGSYLGDVRAPVNGRDWTLEVKCRRGGFGSLYRWLQNRDALILKSDRKEFLVVLPLRRALEVVHAAERNKESNNND